MATSTPTTYTGKQFTIFVTLRVAPENIERFKAVHRPLWKYDFDTPGRFRFVEVWNQSREWFENQQLTKSYYRILWEESQPLWIEESASLNPPRLAKSYPGFSMY
ncbi:hypothetical protein BJX70DRAFT_395140 [Aspergillus crustosus]